MQPYLSSINGGKTHQEVQAITGLKEDTYFRYLRELRKQHGKQFLELGDSVSDVYGLATQILYDRLSKLYSLCIQRLTKYPDTNSKDYGKTVKIAEELSINIEKLQTQGVHAAIEIARRSYTVENPNYYNNDTAATYNNRAR